MLARHPVGPIERRRDRGRGGKADYSRYRYPVHQKGIFYVRMKEQGVVTKLTMVLQKIVREQGILYILWEEGRTRGMSAQLTAGDIGTPCIATGRCCKAD